MKVGYEMNFQNDENKGFEGIDLKSHNGRCFIGVGIFFIVAIIASFLGWYEFKADGTGHIFTATGWNGSVTLYGVKTYNWMGSIAIFLLCILCMSVISRFWQFSKWAIILVAVFCYYELAGATLLTILGETFKPEPGLILNYLAVSFVLYFWHQARRTNRRQDEAKPTANEGA